MVYHRQKGAYSEAEVKEVASFLQLPGNEKLDTACLEILEQWRIKREARRQQPNRERADSSVSSAKHAGKEVASGDQDISTTQIENEIKDEKSTPRRRRNRRDQKAKGKAN